MLELVPDDEVESILRRFDDIDKDKSGTICREELEQELEKRAADLRAERGKVSTKGEGTQQKSGAMGTARVVLGVGAMADGAAS